MAGGGSSSSVVAWVVAEKVSWYCALFLMLLLISNCCDSDDDGGAETATAAATVRMHRLPSRRRLCDEIYVVGEGETLQTISEKCNDPFILEENPHILDFDDVYPGLVIKITAAADSFGRE